MVAARIWSPPPWQQLRRSPATSPLRRISDGTSTDHLGHRGAPLDRSDVDTDQIIPSDWLKRVERTGFEAGLFGEWRDDRDFVLNKQEHAGANILIAGPQFGTGSSREHAVWALHQYGFRAVISPLR
ncbi:MAG: hypothetical protein R2789_16070 [Microthrixaceae bacterium]